MHKIHIKIELINTQYNVDTDGETNIKMEFINTKYNVDAYRKKNQDAKNSHKKWKNFTIVTSYIFEVFY